MPLQTLKDNLPSRDQAMGSLQELLSNPRVASMLAAGVGGAAVGGTLSARSPRRRGESRGARRRRILRDALLTAGAGAGAVGLGQFGYDQLNSVLPEGPQNAISRGASKASLVGLAGAGAGAGHYTRGRANAVESAKNIFRDLGVKLPKNEKTLIHQARQLVREGKTQINLADAKNVGGRGLSGLVDDATSGIEKAYNWGSKTGPKDSWTALKGNLQGKRNATKGILQSNGGSLGKADQLARGGGRVAKRNLGKVTQFARKHPRTAGAVGVATVAPWAFENIAKPIARSIPSMLTYGDN